MKSGQGIFNSWRESGRKGLMPIAWNPARVPGGFGGYGVAFNLDDGTTRYVMTRGKVHRMSEWRAEQGAEEMNRGIEHARERGDPYCYDSRGFFGPYSTLVSPEDPNPLRVVGAFPSPLTQATVFAHNRVENYYAPLFYFVDAVTGQILTIDDAVVLLSDPLRLREIMENWKHVGITFPTYTTVILTDDRDFDLFMRNVQRDSMIAIIDPVFDSNSKPVGGFIVMNIQDMQASGPPNDC